MKQIIMKGHKFMQTKCNVCNCVFNFEDEDIEDKEDVLDNHGCSWGTDFTLTCPYCSKKFTIRESDIKKLWE